MRPTSLVQLAGEWRGAIPAGGVMVETKVDGWRAARFPGVDGRVRLWSRNGMPIEAEHILHRLGLMERVAGEPLMFDGEFLVGDTLAATKAWAERGWRMGGEAGQFFAFDCLTLAEWRAGGSDVPLYQRKRQLLDLARAVEDDPALSWEWRPGSRGRDDSVPPVVVLPDTWAFDPADVMAEARRVWAADGEGLMLKDAESPYRRNRSDAWMKVKPGGPWWRAMRAIAA